MVKKKCISDHDLEICHSFLNLHLSNTVHAFTTGSNIYTCTRNTKHESIGHLKNDDKNIKWPTKFILNVKYTCNYLRKL